MFIALTREISPAIGRCELTHQPRVSIDVDRARAQHRAYEEALAAFGCRVERLPSSEELPDSVFIEDTAVAFDEVAIVTRPGAESRRAETPAVAWALERYRPVRTIEPPGTVDGGDVLVAGRRVFVGRSTRTNGDGIAQMRRLLAPYGYTVCEVPVSGCLHLKSAVTGVADDVLLINAQCVKKEAFGGFQFIDVHPMEPMAANALRIDDDIIYPDRFPRTAERLASRGLRLRTVEDSEVAKAEGAVTCCSVILRNS
jgi:dimethylargininase